MKPRRTPPESSTSRLLPMLLGLAGLFAAPHAAVAQPPSDPPVSDLAEVRGMTISCQTWGWEWGTPGFGEELADLAGLGANWVAIHPYARILEDGRLRWRTIDPEAPPDYLRVPIEEARNSAFGLLVKPHIAYWGSPFSWRGEIAFSDPVHRANFYEDYTRWIVEIAQATRGAQAFSVGTELEGMMNDEAAWRHIVAEVRKVTDAHLTYAANWDTFRDVRFWDALDVIGIQAYFPLSEAEDPDESELRKAWERVLADLRPVHQRYGKPMVFTEFGYSLSLDAARAPYSYGLAAPEDRARAALLQARCMRVGLEVLGEERAWLRGSFLWKWFVGEPGRNDADFQVDAPHIREVLDRVWNR